MSRVFGPGSLLLLGAAAVGCASAQDTGNSAAQGEALDEPADVIVVDGVRRRGVNLSGIEPEVTLGETDIAAYGVSSLAELLEELAPETSSGRGRRGGGRPVVLLNGRRISGFREIGRYPPEALAGVEVLPEETALSYGFSADQRVINFVLKPNVTVRAAEFEAEAPEAGGTTGTELSFQRLSVDGSRRLSLDVQWERRSPLLESERDAVRDRPNLPFGNPGNLGADDFGQPIGAQLGGDASFTVAALQGDSFDAPIIGGLNPLDEQALRTLQPESEDLELGFSRASAFVADSTLTINGKFERRDAESLLGIGEVALDLPGSNPFVPFGDGLTLFAALPGTPALMREARTDTGSLGLSVVSRPGPTTWTLTASYEQAETDTLTDLRIDETPMQARIDQGADPFAVLRGPAQTVQRDTRSRTKTGEAEFVVNARPFDLPAGAVGLTAQAGARTLEQETLSTEPGERIGAALGRDSLTGQLSLDVPLLAGGVEGLGELSVNANAAVEDLSDFGSLYTVGGGFNWRPSDRLRLLVSYTREEGAPSVGELGDPVLVTPNTRVFDFATGETVLVDAVSGGNPDLLADSRDVAKIGLQLRPTGERELTLSVDYTQSLLEDEARDFPALTAEIEAAFPERFTRDGDGALLAIDRRPVNFEESTRRELRTGINWSKRIEEERRGPPPRARKPSGDGEKGGGTPEKANGEERSGGGSRRRRGGPGGARPGRLFVSLYHTYVIEDAILVRDGLPELDLLGGSAVGENGGTPAHELNLSVRRWNRGFGFYGRMQWQSATEVSGAASGGSDLRFSDLMTVTTRFSYDLDRREGLVERMPWLKDTRVGFDVENIFDQKIEVTDAAGETPLRYQPDFIDPIGRSFEIEFRKRF